MNTAMLQFSLGFCTKKLTKSITLGHDAIGSFSWVTLHWLAGSVRFDTTFKVYESKVSCFRICVCGGVLID